MRSGWPWNRAFARWRQLPSPMQWVIVTFALAMTWNGNCSATVVVARNGVVLDGKLGYLPSIDVNPLVTQDPAAQVNQIVLVDDGLRRTYLSNFQVESLAESDPTGFERIRIRQNVATGQRRIGAVTAIRYIGPFDDRGHRVFSIVTPRGPVDIYQGITEVTPLYTRVQGLMGNPSIRWDCRIATSSLPRETLSQVLRRQGVKHGADARIAAVRLMVESERYNDARIELEEAIREFPELDSLDTLLVELRQYSARRLIDEIERRQRAGQHQRCRAILSQFPEDGVAPEALQRVSQLLRQYQQRDAQIAALKQRLAAMGQGVKDPALGATVAQVRTEVDQRLNENTLNRLSDFQRLADDPKMTADTRLAMFVSGWVVGSGNATQNLNEAVSLVNARDLVSAYLQTDAAAQRGEIISRLGREEGGTPQRVVEILRQIDPPIQTAQQQDRPVGAFYLEAPGVKSSTFAYEIQLPDEYDPARRYPTVVTLHGLGRTPQQQLDWWAGDADQRRNKRVGQAARHGYIVVAPYWLPSGKRQYEYTGIEHAAVLTCLRDACRRFAVDTDRVYLSGHSIGGDAAWDIGLAHPDHWAGVIPVVAVGDYGANAPKYVSQYWPNAKWLPLYFVAGELDGNKLELNRRDFDRYLRRPGLDVMITEYIGRGHEHFFEEIHRIFDWMGLHRRDFNRTEYECVSMRPYDAYFFNLELDQLPVRSMVGPYEWPAPRGAQPAKNSFEKTAIGTLRIQTGAASAVLWLTPATVELDGRLTINVNGRSQAYAVAPDVATLLEDARTRADRQQPFWARIELRTGERVSAR